MAKHLKQIGKQLLVFAFIASVFNMYALEVWCGLTMGNHKPFAETGQHFAATGHGEMENCPHHSSSQGTENSCEDHHEFFATAGSASGLQKFIVQSGNFSFTIPEHFNFTDARLLSQAILPVNLFPDVGLKPRVPDIRIFICSLTI